MQIEAPIYFPITHLVSVLQLRILVVALYISWSLLMFNFYITFQRNDTGKKAFWSQIAKKVEYIKKIKEKQDEDKAAVTLHSFKLVG